MFEFIDDASQNMGRNFDVDMEFSAIDGHSVESNTEIRDEEFAKFFCTAGFFVSFDSVSKKSGGAKISVSSKK